MNFDLSSSAFLVFLGRTYSIHNTAFIDALDAYNVPANDIWYRVLEGSVSITQRMGRAYLMYDVGRSPRHLI